MQIKRETRQFLHFQNHVPLTRRYVAQTPHAQIFQFDPEATEMTTLSHKDFTHFILHMAETDFDVQSDTILCLWQCS